ncbi:dipeptide ABC transporter ATP-binding protein [Chitinasiproducens palmae]|uniref:Dipeptide transport system ATP-binding protein n=1 Tax=Chitinasiproducens palmae TaxID=1770053 RepID=A0A1H2PTB7_9BURK|nr:dipeptide ABC transporter ATP-binding protein [Chitinasiproducens palmae]SDV50322.1 dipeptide transport system ATP-binding protein [Chitinasiproducens palmae]
MSGTTAVGGTIPSAARTGPDASGEAGAPRRDVLVAHHLSKAYPVRRGLFSRGVVQALNDVSLSVAAGSTLGVVGESGCGKSTLARQLTLIETPSAGELFIEGQRLDASLDRHARAALRRRVQMVFQNPLASLNPRKTVEQILAEPLAINTTLDGAARRARVAAMLEQVGLRPEHAQRYPHMFSGGQRQRVAIARAMILEPALIVADEPVSALDVSIQAQVLNLFRDLQQRFGTSYVFITHNLDVVSYLADRVMVMYLGRVVESGDTATLFARPRHPYTQVLMAATPSLSRSRRDAEATHAPLPGEPPSPLEPPPGCPFHRRCAWAVPRCVSEVPPLREVDGRTVACHRAEETVRLG